MPDRLIVSPFFLDQRLPALDHLTGPSGELIAPSLADGDIQDRMSSLHQAIAASVSSAIQNGDRPVCISGDCCAAIGVAAGTQQENLDPLLVWFDAHGDFNTWNTTPSGFLGGMPLAMLVGLGEHRLLENAGLRPLAEGRTYLTDARDLDPGERITLVNSAVTHIRRVSNLLEVLPEDQPLYVHFDTDVLDPSVAPAMNYLATGGPNAAQLGDVFQALAETGRIIAISMSTWNPHLDRDGRTADICLSLLRTLMGGS
jgi:arginase